jgi:hypothetical protein
MDDELFRVHDGFVVRTPLHSTFTRLPAAAGGPEPEACRDVLRAAAERAELAEAIEVASPSLAALAVLKYDLRARTRPTPFGLFAGVSAGRFDVAPKVEDDGPARTRTRLDLGWLREVVEAAEVRPDLLLHLDVQAHGMVVARGDRLHVETSSAAVSVRRTPAVEAVLAGMRPARPVADVVADLRDRFPVSEAVATGLITGLVRQGLLLTSLRPPLDGGDPLTHVLTVLATAERRGAAVPLRAALAAVAEARDGYDAADRRRRRRTAPHVALARDVRPRANPVHVDTRQGLRVRLPEDVRAEAAAAVTAMWRMSSGTPAVLAGWRARFTERYGTGVLVPLLEALDETTGVGAPAGYRWPVARPETPEPPLERTTRDRRVAALVAEAVRDGARSRARRRDRRRAGRRR